MIVDDPNVDQELTRIVMPDEDWSNSHALSVVIGDYNRASTYRFDNHDWRWERADRRYLGVVDKKVWEGTNIERSHISVMTAYEQIEALLPRILQIVFGDDPWFEADAIGKTSAEAARKARDIIAAQLHKSRVRKVLKVGCKSGYQYGNGILESCWEYSVYNKKKFKCVFDPKTKQIADPFTGQVINVNTGEYSRRVVEVIEEEIDNRPKLLTIPITQFYIDPNCPTTDPNDAAFTITRTLETVGDIILLRDQDGFDIPDDDDLLELAKNKPSDMGDNTQQNREAYRDVNWQPSIDQTVDPYSLRIECLRRKSKSRETWVLNQRVVIYNRTNPYGRIMQYSPFYTELIDRFYGMSITDVVDGEQLLQEGVINGRLDELSLSLHPPTKVKRGNQSPAYQLRMRPGGLSYSDDPKNDVIRDWQQNPNVQAFQEIQASDMRVQKKTGLTDLAVLGVGGGNNPGARSATGAGLQGQASAARIQGQVENIADELISPICQDFHTLNNFHLDPDQRIEAVDGTMLDPLEIFGAEVRFFSRAASRMQSRMGLLQVLPLVLQNAMNPMLVEQLAAQGKTIDFTEIFQMLLDATGYRKKADWIRPLTDEEKKAMQQQKPSPDMIKWMMQRERLDTMSDMQQDKGEMDTFREIVKAKADTGKTVVSEKAKAAFNPKPKPAAKA